MSYDWGDKQAVDLLAATAHELKKPLAVIHALSDELPQADSMQQINQAARQAISLIENVVLAQKLSAQQLQLNLVPVDIAAVIDETAYSLQGLAQAQGHDLNVRVSRRLPTVMAHKPSLQRMVYSLIDTLVKYSKPDQKIQIEARQVGGQVAVSVLDTLDDFRRKEWLRIINNPGRPLMPSPALGDSSAVSFFYIHRFCEAMNGSFSLQQHPKGQQVFLLKLPQVQQLRLF